MFVCVSVIDLSRLYNCNVTCEGCVALASALKSNHSHLRELDLTDNKPGEAGVTLLSDLLDDPNCKLEKLLWVTNECFFINIQEETISYFVRMNQLLKGFWLCPSGPTEGSYWNRKAYLSFSESSRICLLKCLLNSFTKLRFEANGSCYCNYTYVCILESIALLRLFIWFYKRSFIAVFESRKRTWRKWLLRLNSSLATVPQKSKSSNTARSLLIKVRLESSYCLRGGMKWQHLTSHSIWSCVFELESFWNQHFFIF